MKINLNSILGNSEGGSDAQNNNSESVHCLEFQTKDDEKIYGLIIKIELFLIPALILLAGIIASLAFETLDILWIRVSVVLVAVMTFIGKLVFLIAENPADNVMMITLFGKPIAYARKGGPFTKSIICKTLQIKNQNMVIRFGEKEGGENEIAVSCATPEQAEANKEEFIEMFEGKIKGFEEEEHHKPESITGEAAYKASTERNVNHTQLLFKPSINLVFKIGSKEGFAEDKIGR